MGWIRRRRDALRSCEPGWRSRCEADNARWGRRASATGNAVARGLPRRPPPTRPTRQISISPCLAPL
uniref:Uncharacterized protein n=1 Tax=Oryza nivara TaxID=4536 RepID=A0A0E0I7L7_ORYNI